MSFLLLKWVHILSAILLFGTGFGSAFYKFMADRSRDLHAMARTNHMVVLADWIFTTPTVILQPVTGFAMLSLGGYTWTMHWVQWSLILFVIAGLCWLPVVFLQFRMRDMTDAALQSNTVVASAYWNLFRRWMILGIIAFSAMIATVGLMVSRPV